MQRWHLLILLGAAALQLQLLLPPAMPAAPSAGGTASAALPPSAAVDLHLPVWLPHWTDGTRSSSRLPPGPVGTAVRTCRRCQAPPTRCAVWSPAPPPAPPAPFLCSVIWLGRSPPSGSVGRSARPGSRSACRATARSASPSLGGDLLTHRLHLRLLLAAAAGSKSPAPAAGRPETRRRLSSRICMVFLPALQLSAPAVLRLPAAAPWPHPAHTGRFCSSRPRLLRPAVGIRQLPHAAAPADLPAAAARWHGTVRRRCG